MLPGQMLYGYCSLRHMFSARYGPRKLPLKFFFGGGGAGGEKTTCPACRWWVVGGWLAGWVGGENGNKAISASLGVEVEFS